MATSMNNDDQILRAYATITSIRANVPERHEIEGWSAVRCHVL